MAASSTLPHATTAPPHFYLDDNWKLSKKESSSRSSRSSTSAAASSATTTTTPLMKNSSQRKCSFSRKCARLVKEQRARFYIMRRCVTMLICWRDYNDS